MPPDFETIVRNNSGVPHKWCQNRILRHIMVGKEGVCKPLSVMWLRNRGAALRTNDSTWKNWAKFMQDKDNIDEMMELKMKQLKRVDGWVQEYLGYFGFRIMGDHTISMSRTGLSISDVFRYIELSPAYVLMDLTQGMTGKQVLGGHAFAIDWWDPKKVAFFDPNFGQGNFATFHDMKKAILALWRFQYPDFQGMAFVQRYSFR